MSVDITQLIEDSPPILLKENFQQQLQEVKSLPEDIAIGYKNWVRGLVKTASQQISAEANPAPEQAEQATA